MQGRHTHTSYASTKEYSFHLLLSCIDIIHFPSTNCLIQRSCALGVGSAEHRACWDIWQHRAASVHLQSKTWNHWRQVQHRKQISQSIGGSVHCGGWTPLLNRKACQDLLKYVAFAPYGFHGKDNDFDSLTRHEDMGWTRYEVIGVREPRWLGEGGCSVSVWWDLAVFWIICGHVQTKHIHSVRASQNATLCMAMRSTGAPARWPVDS
jgi:hypothetical protein